MINPPRPNELTLNRIYDAPLDAVWQAWIDPEQAAQWWGPRGFSITTDRKEFKPGGQWVYTMHGPDGVDYPNIATYLQIEHHARMVYDHGATLDRPPMFRVTVFFTDLGEKTAMAMTMAFESAEVAAQSRVFIKKAGGDATWDRLAEYLAKHRSGKEVFVINRSFAAPRERLFELWTKPDHLSKWLAPNGSLDFIRADIREGGSTFSVMKHSDDSSAMYGRATYRTVVKPEQLIYTQQFCDPSENIGRHPLSATWPLTMLTTIDFVSEVDDHSRIKITWQPDGDVTKQEIETFASARAGMTAGWTASLDGLEAYLIANW